MWCPEGALQLEIQRMLELPRHRLDAGDGEGFIRAERRQQRRQLTGQMGLAATGWTHHQQVMTAGGRQGQALPRQPLGLNRGRLLLLRLGSGPAHPQAGPFSFELLHQLLQIWGGAHHQVWNQCRFIGIARRYHQGLSSVASGQLGDGNHTAAWSEAAIEPQFAGAPDAVQARSIQLATGDEQSQGNR